MSIFTSLILAFYFPDNAGATLKKKKFGCRVTMQNNLQIHVEYTQVGYTLGF